MSGSLERMVITAYTDANFTAKTGSPFTVWINPATYTQDLNIRYTNRQAPGSNGPSPEFNQVGQDNISFDLVFDTTGVIPPPVAGTPLPANGVATLIATFRKLVLTVNGKIHRPNYVMLSWAQLQFQCVLSRMKVNYTLFKPNGTPLRATVSVTFLGFASEKQLAQEAQLSSPDVSHLVTVVSGDTLPALSHRIYGSSLYYMQVAKHNNLTNFRRLTPGTQLVFPPLSGTAS
jgi:LysM repeat protein